MRRFLDPVVLSRLAPLPLKARSPMLGSVAGKHRSSVRGSSVEFAAYRKYVPGDDTRRLDWRAYGRSDRFYIKEFEADTNLRLCLVVDTSGSMQFASEQTTFSPNNSEKLTKLEYARRLAGTLAYLASGQGDAVALYGAGQNMSVQIPPRRSGTHLRMVLDQLETLQAEGETGLAPVLHEVAERIAQRALVVIISDLFVQPDVLSKCFQHLRYRKHDVVVFHLLDQSELEFEFDRPIRFLDLEGNTHVLADPPLIQDQYQQSLQKYLSDVHGVMSEAQVDYHRTLLHEDYDQVLARFLLGRN